VRDNLIGFLSGLVVVMTIRAEELMEVLLIGALGGAAGMIGKSLVAHLKHRFCEWERIRRELAPGSLSRDIFISNSVFLFALWFLVFLLLICLGVIISFIYKNQ
jgi:hypothetical protein